MDVARRAKFAALWRQAFDDDRFHLLFGFALPAALYLVFVTQISTFTIDDAYISFRYARNLNEGLGLVYNPGQYVEGYTNFLWTLLLALGMRLGAEPQVVAKVLGAVAAIGTMAVVFAMSRRFAKAGGNPRAPCLATWLMATSINVITHTFLGLEGGLFLFLLTSGFLLLIRENDRSDAKFFPWSGLVFALAALTRPEGPAYFAIAWFVLARPPLFRWRHAYSIAAFTAIVGAHLIWRHSYYGAWLPNTLAAKTGDLRTQATSGLHYISVFANEGGLLVALLPLGIGVAFFSHRRRPLLALTALTAFNLAYLLLVGADWMPKWRYLLPLEPFAYLLADQALNRLSLVPAPSRTPIFAGLTLLSLFGLVQRAGQLPGHFDDLHSTEGGWRSHEGQSASWFAAHGDRGAIAIGDIGEVGFRSNQPVFDLLGLVTPAVGKLPGGYGRKDEKPFVAAFYAANPDWFVTITNDGTCKHAAFPLMRAIIDSPEHSFWLRYDLAHTVRLNKQDYWCLLHRRTSGEEINHASLFDFEERSFAGWTVTGRAFGDGPVHGAAANQQQVVGFAGKALANSFSSDTGDDAVGRLESPEFIIDRAHIGLRVGGGASFGTRVELLVDQVPVTAAFGENTEDLRRVEWDVGAWRGHPAKIRIVDDERGSWGHILVDDIDVFDLEKDLQDVASRATSRDEAPAESTATKATPVKSTKLSR